MKPSALALSATIVAVVLICTGSFSFISTNLPFVLKTSFQQETSFKEWYSQQQQQLINPLSVEILSPIRGQNIVVGNNGSLNISGLSSDNSTTDCQVSVIMNAFRPYQAVNATGPNGPDDYSNWNMTFDPVYYRSSVKEGPDNEIAAKLACLPDPGNMTKSYSVNVTGIKPLESGTMNNDTFRTDNESSSISPLASDVIRSNTTSGNNKLLSLSMDIDEDRFRVGEDQTVLIGVYDSVTGQQLEMATGIFRITNPSGQTVEDSFLMMENGDISHDLELEENVMPGNYTATLEAYADGYEPSSKNLTFEVTESSGDENEDDETTAESDEGELFE